MFVTSAVVEAHGLRMAYGDVVVLDDIDLTVSEGEIVALTGVNGVGKSTLLSCLAGFRRQTAGTVSVLGGPPSDTPEFWRSVAIVGDQPTWYPGLTVRELLELIRMTHRPLPSWCVPVADLIEIFGLTARADASPLSLSSGQRQRLSIAAALVRPSSLLLLDEPEQSLDAGFRQELAVLLRDEYIAGDGTVVMATHDHEFAVTAGARIVQLAEGRITDSGDYPPAESETAEPEATEPEASEPEQAGRNR